MAIKCKQFYETVHQLPAKLSCAKNPAIKAMIDSRERAAQPTP